MRRHVFKVIREFFVIVSVVIFVFIGDGRDKLTKRLVFLQSCEFLLVGVGFEPAPLMLTNKAGSRVESSVTTVAVSSELTVDKLCVMDGAFSRWDCGKYGVKICK